MLKQQRNNQFFCPDKIIILMNYNSCFGHTRMFLPLTSQLQPRFLIMMLKNHLSSGKIQSVRYDEDDELLMISEDF